MGGFSAKALVGSEIYLLLAIVRTTPKQSQVNEGNKIVQPNLFNQFKCVFNLLNHFSNFTKN